MGYRHTRDSILVGALAVAADAGLSQVTFGRVAKHLAINDRTVVYYFATKHDLITGILIALGDDLRATLTPAFTAPKVDHIGVLEAAWPILAQPAADATFALFFEATGLAAAGRDPYRSLVPPLVAAWIDWTAEHIDGPPSHRRTEATTAVAVIDGLLLLRQLAGAEAADRAARHLIRARPAR